MKKLLFCLFFISLISCGEDSSDDSGNDAGITDAAKASVSQSEECKKYLECYKAADPNYDPTTIATMEEDGSCWTSAELAQSCTDACKTSMEAVYASYPDVPECQP